MVIVNRLVILLLLFICQQCSIKARSYAQRAADPVIVFLKRERAAFSDFLRKCRAEQQSAERLFNYIEQSKQELKRLQRELTPEEIALLRFIQDLENRFYHKFLDSFHPHYPKLNQSFVEIDAALAEAQAAHEELAALHEIAEAFAELNALIAQRKMTHRG